MQPIIYPPYRQTVPQPVPTEEERRNNGIRTIRKTSNAVGFYILTYSATMYALAIGLTLLLKSLIGDVSGFSEYLMDIFLSVAAAFIPGIVYMVATGFSPRDAFGKTAVAPTLLIPLVMVGMGVSMVANYAAVIFDQNISLFGLENHAGTIDTGSMTPAEIILSVIAISIVPAFAEEFAFRGLVMGSLKKYGRAFAVVTSSIMFSAMHANTSQIVFVIFVGLVFGYVDMLTDSIVPSVIIHFLNNFYATLMQVLESNGDLDETLMLTINVAIVLLFVIGGLLSFVYLALTHKECFRLSDNEKCDDPVAAPVSYKGKLYAFFINPGILISLTVFLGMTILNLLPQ